MSNREHSKGVRKEYNSISDTYNKRYEINPLNGIAKTLSGLVDEIRAVYKTNKPCFFIIPSVSNSA